MNDREVPEIPEDENTVEVDMEELADGELPPLTYDDDERNLVTVFQEHPDGVEVLRKVSALVLDTTADVREKTAGHREERARNWEMFSNAPRKKSPPFDHMTNLSLPILPESFSRLHGLLMSEIFGDWSHVVSVRGVGPDDEAVAELNELHSNWQFTTDFADFPRQASRGVMQFLWGDVVAYSYFDEVMRQNRHIVLSPDEVYMPFTFTSTQPDLSDCPYVIMLRKMGRPDLQRLRKVWENVDLVLARDADDFDSEPDSPMAKTISRVTKIEFPDDDKSLPYNIVHYEGWDNGILPGQNRDRFIQAIVDWGTRRVLSLRIHEAEDWKDVVAYREKQAEADVYREDLAAYENAVIASMQMDINRPPPQPLSPLGSLGFEPGQPLPGAPASVEAVRPPRPNWMKSDDAEPTPPELKPIRMWSHAVCFEPMMGTLGLGYLQGVAGYHRAAGVALNQIIDQATLNNVGAWLTASGVSLPSPLPLKPGAVIPVTGVSAIDGGLDAGIKEIRPGPPSAALFQVVELAKAAAEGHAGSNPVLSGAAGKSGETWRGHSARMEAATKELSVRGQNIARNFFRQILYNNCTLNSRFLPEREMVSLYDWKVGGLKSVTVLRRNYERNYQWTLRTDLRFASERSRQDDAMELLALTAPGAPLEGNEAFKYAAITRLLEARRDYELIPLLGKRPPAPPMFGMPPAPPPGMGQPPTEGQPPNEQPG